jgi:GrpB-like predicted nucleotidyltransferase (UPF0157 family)
MRRNNEPLRVCEYDPSWPAQFTVLARRVRATLGDIVWRIEHIGSTAVSGLASKPVIDLDVVLTWEGYMSTAVRGLSGIGYFYEGDLGVCGREAFRSPLNEPRHHLYVLSEGSIELRRHLAFRDALRVDAVLRDRYASLKQLLARQHPHNRGAYNEGKSAFIKAAVSIEDTV